MASPLVSLKSAVTWVANRLPRLIDDYDWLDNAYTAVGWDARSGKYPDGTPVAVVALINEFGSYNENGSVRVPARPFMRPAYQENKPALLRLRQQAVKRVNEGRMTPEKALDVLGFRLMTMIRRKILSNVKPELAPSTLKSKRAAGRPAVTLINTRRMLDELTYHIYTTQLPEGAQTATAQASQAKGRAASIKSSAVAKQRMERIRTANQIRAEKKRLRQELRQAKRDQKATLRQINRARTRMERRAKKAARNEVRKHYRKQKRAEKMKKRLEARIVRVANKKLRRDFARARRAITRRNKRAARMEVKRHYARARRAARLQKRRESRIVRRERRQQKRDFSRARRAQKRELKRQDKRYKKFRARETRREKKDLGARIARFRKTNARFRKENRKDASHAERMYKRHISRLQRRAGRQMRGLSRIAHLTPKQKEVKAAREKERRAQRAAANKVRRSAARDKKRKREAEKQARKRYNPNITLGED